MKFSLLNGQQVDADTAGIILENRGFLYGDSLFESIRVMYGQPLWLNWHFERLQRACQLLQIQLPFGLAELQQMVHTLIELNKCKSGGRLRLDVWRSAGGRYKPSAITAEFALQLEALAENEFKLNSKGLQLGDSKRVKHPLFLPDIKSSNALLYVLAAQEAQANSKDDVFLYDSEGALLESSNSNVFLLKDGQLITPALNRGSLPGILRKLIVEKFPAAGISIREQLVSHNELMQAEEVYLTNAISGLQWVSAWRQKRYFKKSANSLVDILNHLSIQSLTGLT
ncbi:MAG: aminotransferase class IV [Bacteroidia bacterium]